MVLQRVVWIFRTFKLMNFGGAIFKNTPSSLWVFWLVEKFWAVYRIWPLSLRLGISTRQGMLFLKNGPTLANFLFIFVLFKHKFYKKNCRLLWDSNRIVGIKGEHADHLTTTTAQGKECSSTYGRLSTEAVYWPKDPSKHKRLFHD